MIDQFDIEDELCRRDYHEFDSQHSNEIRKFVFSFWLEKNNEPFQLNSSDLLRVIVYLFVELILKVKYNGD